MPIRESLADALVDSFLGGPWSAEELLSRAAALFAIQSSRNWLSLLVLNVLSAFPATSPIPTRRKLKTFVRAKTRITKVERRVGATRLKRRPPKWKPTMQPAAGPPSQWTVPAIVSHPQLADWLGLTIAELDWFADRSGWGSDSAHESLRHYRCRWIKKPSGGLRLLESPKPRLKQIQRRILDEILSRVPIHSAAHAFRTGRSIVTHVAPHAGQYLILHVDLREFFSSIRASQVNATFRTMGYPERVASLLTGLCTHSTPSHVLADGIQRVHDEGTWQRHRSPHLPQGAPTSPALANLCAYRLDGRLAGLARVVGARYTRYADDLVFSGGRDLRKCLRRLRILINAIVLNEGFEIRQRKTHVMIYGTRQQISGIRVNQHPNIPRETFDELKAILHNCRRFGPESQNRAGHAHFREHLQGRLAYWSSINPDRIAKLRRIFDEIKWPTKKEN
jgi:hypothetical protein